MYFATSNKGKFAEAQKALSPLGIEITHFPFSHNEIRSDRLDDVAREAAEEAFRQCQEPVFVEDSGLFIKSLNGFPGTYSAWVLKKVGIPGILRLMGGSKDRSAYFEACIAYADANGIKLFHGRCEGTISEIPRGTGGFGYDPIFVPEGFEQTFAQNIELKNKLSHRYISLLELAKSLKPR
ncbi:MAG TPA: XTP/dITP diphosphatase [Candidatus Bilamarchaeum sp.]|nr:XTP/dITP diphosphatase [Candidatus Bilamarchaeum sp.]